MSQLRVSVAFVGLCHALYSLQSAMYVALLDAYIRMYRATNAKCRRHVPMSSFITSVKVIGDFIIERLFCAVDSVYSRTRAFTIILYCAYARASSIAVVYSTS